MTKPLKFKTDSDRVRLAVHRVTHYFDVEMREDRKRIAWPPEFPLQDFYLILAVVPGLIDYFEDHGGEGSEK